MKELRRLQGEAVKLRKQLAERLQGIPEHTSFFNPSWGITLQKFNSSSPTWSDLKVYVASQKTTRKFNHRAGFNSNFGWNYNIQGMEKLWEYDKELTIKEHCQFEIALSNFVLEAIKPNATIPTDLLKEVKSYFNTY